ncbi:hypothetical protein SE17_12230 [Kouleothrix aurantiaca]|uniref:Uncharacterized protein n=1 Tax=Kouleothrix aurantiaca TaxID=186479 RepID=A0A0N8PSK6_9CHLR|nr:hypothetical protein SE17_12230 [Kouleothrix aurantiaca]
MVSSSVRLSAGATSAPKRVSAPRKAASAARSCSSKASWRSVSILRRLSSPSMDFVFVMDCFPLCAAGRFAAPAGMVASVSLNNRCVQA